MQIFATFEDTGYLELAISKLGTIGIIKENIYAVPLDNRKEERQLFDTLHRSDGTSMTDIGMVLATVFSVIGASRGFILEWGPIYWGLIGALFGFFLGVAIRWFINRIIKKKAKAIKGKHSEVILIIDCEERQADLVENIIWSHFAIGVATVK